MVGLRALAKSWKYAFGAQASKACDFNNELIKKPIGFLISSLLKSQALDAWAPKAYFQDLARALKPTIFLLSLC